MSNKVKSAYPVVNGVRTHPSQVEPVNGREVLRLSGQSVGWSILSLWALIGWVPTLITLGVEFIRSMAKEEEPNKTS